MAKILSKKRKHAAGLHWRVQDFDGNECIFAITLPKGEKWPEPRIVELLRRLVCRHLAANDIIDGSLPPRSQFYNPVLKDHLAGHPWRLNLIEQGVLAGDWISSALDAVRTNY
jgi:hypothetical protein